jgi:hypothetical protein
MQVKRTTGTTGTSAYRNLDVSSTATDSLAA